VAVHWPFELTRGYEQVFYSELHIWRMACIVYSCLLACLLARLLLSIDCYVGGKILRIWSVRCGALRCVVLARGEDLRGLCSGEN
jgi:hypothetical protein